MASSFSVLAVRHIGICLIFCQKRIFGGIPTSLYPVTNCDFKSQLAEILLDFFLVLCDHSEETAVCYPQPVGYFPTISQRDVLIYNHQRTCLFLHRSVLSTKTC